MRIAVSLKIESNNRIYRLLRFQSAVRIAVSLKRRPDARERGSGDGLFQSAVRIAVSLKPLVSNCTAQYIASFNPPCGSLSR